MIMEMKINNIGKRKDLKNKRFIEEKIKLNPKQKESNINNMNNKTKVKLSSTMKEAMFQEAEEDIEEEVDTEVATEEAIKVEIAIKVADIKKQVIEVAIEVAEVIEEEEAEVVTKEDMVKIKWFTSLKAKPMKNQKKR